MIGVAIELWFTGIMLVCQGRKRKKKAQDDLGGLESIGGLMVQPGGKPHRHQKMQVLIPEITVYKTRIAM